MSALTVQDERTLTELDHVRIARLLPASPNPAHPLGELLDGADVVPSRAVAADVVTMYSTVVVADVASGQERKLTLCYPSDAEPAEGFISVLAPVGASLLGLRVGDVARWRTPDGEPNETEVRAILFQPEASGDYTL
jgi:regulator of nucleoside diphosphate kinase